MHTYLEKYTNVCVRMSNYVLYVEIKVKYKYKSSDGSPYSTERSRSILILILYEMHLDY